MVKRRRRRKKRSALDYIRLPSIPHLDLDSDTKRGIFIVFIWALGALSILGLLDMAGLVGEYLKMILTLLFGWGKWILPLLFVVWGYMLYDEERFEIRAGNYIGMILFLFSFHGLLFLFVEYGRWGEALKAGFGGGYVGWILASTFIKLMGFIASFLATLGLLIVSLLLAFNTSLANLFGRESMMAKILYPFNFILAKLFGSKEEEDDDEEEEKEDDDEDDNEDEEEEEDDDEEEDEEEQDDEDDNEDEDEEEEEDDEDEDEEEEKNENKKEEDKEPKFASKPVKDAIDNVWWKPNGVDINIPLKLLTGKSGRAKSGDIEHNKEIIQNALSNFGIPVEMGDISVGPTVTQYTFRPSEGIKLSRITNLSNDLALALAAHPIRIEAPIPGKHLVGVEVPNQTKAIVTLKEMLASKAYKERKHNLMIALGKDVAGDTIFDDITKMPHLLVAGATNSGKSVCLNSIIVSLMYQNNPDELRFIMVDPKRVELPVYNGMPYLMAPVITNVGKTINALKWCLNEMDRRFDILSKSGKRNIQSYNETAKMKMPYIIFIIDELADLMVAAAKEIEGAIIRLAQMARAVGIHLILATQRPSVDVITGLIKANMPARIAFSVASGTDSRTILDSLGADKLLGRGDMLFINAERSKPVRLQGAFLSDLEIKKISRYVKDKGGEPYYEDITERQKVKGIAGVGLDGTKGDEDDLLLEAKEIVVKMNKASASLLQRKLRIGYARAASILDQLEELGIIGPANGAKPREIMISSEQMEAMDNEGISALPMHSREESKPQENYLGEESGTPPVFKKDDDSDEEENIDNEETEEDSSLVKTSEEEDEEEENNEDDNGGDDEDEEEDEGKYFSR